MSAPIPTPWHPGEEDTAEYGLDPSTARSRLETIPCPDCERPGWVARGTSAVCFGCEVARRRAAAVIDDMNEEPPAAA